MVFGKSNQYSEFNMNIELLKLVSALLIECATASINRDLHKWFNHLMTLARQIKFSFKDEEKKSNEKFMRELTNLDNQYCNYINKLNEFKGYSDFFNLLDEYESFIRKCLDKRDMLIKYKEDARLAITKR